MTDPANKLEDYDFELPPELIAQHPADRRSDSRLLVLDRRKGSIEHRMFQDLPAYLGAPDRLVLNTTRVVPARAFGRREDSGGRVEVLFVHPGDDNSWKILLKTGGRAQPGLRVAFGEGAFVLELLRRDEGAAWWARLEGAVGFSLEPWLESHGFMPLPPYIKRDREDETQREFDRERYQTVYSEESGAAAAPTAGLHFDDAMFEDLGRQGVQTSRVLLHVGLGTFAPVQCDDIRDHRMHSERFVVDEACARELNQCRRNGGRVVAVGTTSLRALESAWDPVSGMLQARDGETDIYIHPPRPVHSIDALLTNFHLPKSSLLFLISALAGRKRVLRAYEEAVREGYRFFSYGDAMLIL